MFSDLYGNTIAVLVDVVNEKADGGADASVEVISNELLVDYITEEYATLIMPQIDQSNVFFATLIIMFPTRMRPDVALKLAADFFAIGGHSSGYLN